jgi:hypothetical protein
VWRASRTQDADLVPVWRFFNRDTGAHFYTTDNAERQRILVTWPQFADEGPAFYAYRADAFDRMPVHRFYNTQTQTHFYTAEESEKDFVLRTYPSFAYEGVSYYAIALPPSPTRSASATRSAWSTRRRSARPAPSRPGVRARRGRVGRRAARPARERLPAERVLVRVARRERGLQIQRRARHGDLPLRRGPAHAVQAALALLHQRALRARPAAAARRVGAVADPGRVRHEDPDMETAYVQARYHQMLADNAFGNFEGLLYQVTLSPAMGHYLDMVDNAKATPQEGTEPNENYARELLQLFSIGTIELKRDGTPLLDATRSRC